MCFLFCERKSSFYNIIIICVQNNSVFAKYNEIYIFLYSKEQALQHKTKDDLPFIYILTDPPEVNVINVISYFGETRLDCIARGVPESYTYSRWEHKSMFGEHIRYLDGFGNGTLSLQNKSKLKRYQDNGLYVCHVSNGVLNSNGMVVQMGEYVLRAESKFM